MGIHDAENAAALVALKERATAWVDRFWAAATEMDTLMKMLTFAFEISGLEFDDTQPVDVNFERTHTSQTFLKLRALRHNAQITERAVQFLANFVHVPGDVSMYMAAIVHTFRSVDISNTNLITYEWVRSLLEDKHLTREAMGALWQNQYLNNGGNLVDIAAAFELLTADEEPYVTNDESEA